jgi:hypothetical protein
MVETVCFGTPHLYWAYGKKTLKSLPPSPHLTSHGSPRVAWVSRKTSAAPPARHFGDVLVKFRSVASAPVFRPGPSPAHLRSGRTLHRLSDCKLTTTQLLPPSSRPALFRPKEIHCAVTVSIGAISGFPCICKEIVERLGEQILNRGVAVSSEDTQLPLHCRRKIASDVALPFSAGPEVRTLGRGR